MARDADHPHARVDPDLKLVLVQTALSGGQPEFDELLALWTALRELVNKQ
jgi:hypothetical protein